MKATEIYLILCQMDAGEITLQEAHELILRLFDVSGECVHDYQLDTLKNDILCTECGLSKYLE